MVVLKVLSNPNIDINRIQILAIFGSTFAMLFILRLIRNKKIKEEYSLLWLFFSIIFVVFSIWRDGLDYLSKLIGIAYPPAALFLLLLTSIFIILIQFSIIISKHSESLKTLAQELGILKLELEDFKKDFESSKKNDKSQ
tara:strand:- start:15604 stop:16023 length:420 start_codon:yes stop_codon:yes gene_type:complete